METRRLGRTEHPSSVAILGAAAFLVPLPRSTEAAFHAALAAGVNHSGHRAAVRAGPGARRAPYPGGPGPTVRWLQDHAGEPPTASGPSSRSPSAARVRLLRPLPAACGHRPRRAGPPGRGGRGRSCAAKEEGLCRFVGITGHGLETPVAQRTALERYDLDTVMFPVNPRLWADPDYRPGAEALLEEARRRDVGVMAIKAGAARPWGDQARHATTWYEPYRSAAELRRGIEFALSTPGVVAFCTPGDVSVLEDALDIAASAAPMDSEGRYRATAQVAGEQLIFPMPA